MIKRAKIVVIDDQLEERKSIYEKFLGNFFDITFIGNEKEVPNINNMSQLKMLIIDRYFDGWGLGDMEKIIDTIPSLISKDIPIVAVSSHWNDDNGKAIREFNLSLRKYKIIRFLSWEEVANESSPSFNTNIIKWENLVLSAFEEYWDQYMHLDNDNDKITIIQIADLQFGGDAAPDAFADRYTIPTYLKNNLMNPHLIAFCGDITEHGKTNEFEYAQTWLDEFTKTVWGKENNRRVLLTVGNHDCNFDAFSQFQYSFDFKNNSFATRSERLDSINWSIANNKLITTESIIFQNYLAFEKNYTTNSRSVWKTDKLNIVNDTFINWGIRIIQINSVANINPYNIKGQSIDKDEMMEIIRYCTVEAKETNIFTILISHFAPPDLGYTTTGQENQWSEIATLLKQVGVNLWLCGHKHCYERGNIEDYADNDASIPYFRVASLRLSPRHIEKNGKTGFNQIELIRKDGIVKTIRITARETNGGKIQTYGVIKEFEVKYDLKQNGES